MEAILRPRAHDVEKEARLNQLQHELNEYDRQRRAREESEEHERTVLADDLAARISVTPLSRPVGDEEANLIDLEKLDMFREFQQ
jgi:hypothetical protein